MSTYTRPDKFVPVNISSDPSTYLNYVQKRSDLSAMGEATVRSQYKQYLDLDLTHDQNKEKLNGFLENVTKSINNQASKDLSNLDNVKSILKTFEPLTKDNQYNSVLQDNRYTKHYKEQNALAESYKTHVDKKGNIGTYYSDYNNAIVNKGYQDFKNADYSNPNSWKSLESYTPYHDYTAEIQKSTLEFLKQPDKFEIEKLDPSTGLTVKHTFEGKSADKIQAYLQTTLSEKAKNQMMIEGRVISWSNKEIADIDSFKKTIFKGYDDNQKTYQDQLDDLIAFSSEGGVQLSASELKDRKTKLEANIAELKVNKENLNNDKKLNELYNDKESIFANHYVNSKISTLSSVLENKRPSITYGTNSAYVSMLNRAQGYREFKEDLAQKQTMHNDKMLLAKYQSDNTLKGKGINPATGLPMEGEQGPYNYNPVPYEKTIEDYEKEVDTYISDVNSKLATSMSESLKDAMFAGNTQDPVKAFAYVNQLGKRYLNQGKTDPNTNKSLADPYITSILNKDPKNLTPKERADMNIIHNLQRNDSETDILNSLQESKKSVNAEIRPKILQELSKQGLTLDKVNRLVPGANFKSMDEVADAVANDKQLTQGSSFVKMLSAAIPLIPAIGPGIAGQIYNNTGKKGALSSIKGDKQTEISNLSFLQKAGIALPFMPIVGPGVMSQAYNTPATSNNPLADLRDEATRKYHEKIIPTGLQKTQSRPLATQTETDKMLNSNFNARVREFEAKYSNEFKEKNIDPNSVQSITEDRINGKYVITVYPTEIDKESGKIKKTGPVEPYSFDAPELKTLNNELNKNYSIALGNSNGVLAKTEVSKEYNIPFDYNVRTASGSPYLQYSKNKQPIIAELKINNDLIQIPQEFTTPLDAVEYVRKLVPNIESVFANEVIKEQVQNFYKVAKTEEEFNKMKSELKGSKITSLIRNRINEAQETGEIYKIFNLKNPNTSSADDIIDQYTYGK